MKDTHLPPALENERSQTDQSLDAERVKTDDSMTEARVKIERHTNGEVQKKRDLVDELTLAARKATDLDRRVHDPADKILHERASVDRAVEVERIEVDAVLKQERELKNSNENRFLEDERELTDRNLSNERERTDFEAQSASVLLQDEKDEHSKTKISLTTRDEFLAIVSHDLKNPIGAASMCADMLLEDSNYRTMPAELRHWIEFIKRNTDTALRLIDDLLDVERIGSGKLHLEMKKHRIADIVRDAMASVAHTAAAKTIFLRATPSTIHGDVVCDRDRIMQVLSNLLGNALKFTPDHGSVVITVKPGPNELLISVRDTGPGIAPEKKDVIFTRFAQLGLNDRRGLGLGLFISKKLIEGHKGRIWVESELGTGSNFFFTIPNL